MRFLLSLLTLSLISFNAHAGEWLEWHSNNAQLLHGNGFELSDDRQTTLTLEHVNGWKYGDNFVYLDYVFGEPDLTNAEFSPRLSLSKMSGQDLSFGPVQDVLLSATWEKGRRFDTYLYGGAVDFDIPGFNFFQTNWYHRDNPDADGSGWQTTFVWSRPFALGGYNMSLDGYFDYADYEEGTTNFFTQPQLLLDAGSTFGFAPEQKAYIGLEYRYWHNKFGIDGLTEKAPQIMTKWVF